MGGGHNVYLIGSLLPVLSIVSSMEEAGLNIVGDRLTESRRLFSAPEVSMDGDPYESIAESILKNCPSPTQDCFREILAEDREEIRRKAVRGVVFVTQKFCEPYDYLYPVYKGMLDELGIPLLRIVLAGSADGRRQEAAIEAFADLLREEGR